MRRNALRLSLGERVNHIYRQSANMAFIYAVLLAIIFSVVISGCAELQRENKMSESDPLAPCPNRPNCVSSAASDPRHAVAPMQLAGDSDMEWDEVRMMVGRLPRSRMVKATDRYLHVILRSRVFGFIDDLELKLDPQSSVIAIRSASRTGHFDFGVNRRRVESLREQLTADALIE